MEPEVHRLDREAMLAERIEIEARGYREVDEALAAAAEKRRAFQDWFVDSILSEAVGELARRRDLADRRAAFGHGPRRVRLPAAPAQRRPGDPPSTDEQGVEATPPTWAATG